MEMTLDLPRNYVEIEEDEMMYLDGGYWTHRGHADWTYTVSKSKCRSIASLFYAGATLGAALANFGVPYASQVAIISGLLGAIFDVIGMATKGLRIYFHTMSWGRTPRWFNVLY